MEPDQGTPGIFLIGTKKLQSLLALGILLFGVSGFFMSRLQVKVSEDLWARQSPFQFSFTPAAAHDRVVRMLPSHLEAIRTQLYWDSVLIVGYVLIGFALAGLVRPYAVNWTRRRCERQRHSASGAEKKKAVDEEEKSEILGANTAPRTTVIIVLVAGLHDVIENAGIALALTGFVSGQPVVFVANAVKDSLLLVALFRVISDRFDLKPHRWTRSWLPTLWPRSWFSKISGAEILTFQALVEREADQLSEADQRLKRESPHPARKYVVPPKTTTGEPWLREAPLDRFGLALSGGGIRSATFNLGLTQAMANLGVLRHVDYLSTVSGGGYIGGFWTRWLAHHSSDNTAPEPAHFPAEPDTGGADRLEVRHLREFSRFLLPRAGVYRNEFWSVVLTIVGGILPSLAFALALVALGWAGWHWTMELILRRDPLSVKVITALVAALLLILEWRWLRENVLPVQWLKTGSGDDRRPLEVIGYLLGSEIIVIVVALSWAGIVTASLPGADRIIPLPWAGDPDRLVRWLIPALPLGLAALFLLILRPPLGRALRELRAKVGVSLIAGIERSLSRALGVTAFAAVLGLLWWTGTQLDDAIKAYAAGTAVGLAGLFAWVRKWLFEPPEDTRSSRFLERLGHLLRRAVPRLLATTFFLIFLVLVVAGVEWSWSWTTPEFSYSHLNWVYGGVLLFTLLFFDPARVGLHEFYRSRISRCYLGASNIRTIRREDPAAGGNRSLNEHPLDDITLGELRALEVRPIHLVCTAANDLSGDHLANLYRGARSAVLSQNGITVGNETARLDQLRYSAALTASAAAFNSQMGRVSMTLGPPVAFLMSALNLRLGLWVPHPRVPWRNNYWLPGRFFALELFGFSRSNWRHLHLSDGGHFDNTGLYELVRRHCRWIIAADCGADGKTVFDDLANVIRRVREDFGVEIDLDTGPLREDDNGRVKQHAVVGTIHYDGPTGADKGTILLFKPTLSGDESADIRNYKARTEAFPHESTGDQFFDEAQWESYRRLGEHVGWSVLGFAESIDEQEYHFTDRLFLGVRERLHPSAQDHQATFVDMSNRCAELEADLCSNGPAFLRLEIFPEAAMADGGPPRTDEHSEDDEVKALSYLMRAVQIMEDVWLSCDLERYWSHPLNEGWMNYFQRWASTPTFRRWWPVLRPIYSNGFREFAKARFEVGVVDPSVRDSDRRQQDVQASNAILKLHAKPPLNDFEGGHAWRQFLQRSKPPRMYLDGRLTVLVYRMQLADGSGELSGRFVDVGFALAEEKGENPAKEARISADYFYVPPALAGSGIIGRQLDAVIHHYECEKFKSVTIEFDAAPRGEAARAERVRQIEFFKSRGFTPETGGVAPGKVSLTKKLEPTRPVHDQADLLLRRVTELPSQPPVMQPGGDVIGDMHRHGDVQRPAQPGDRLES